MLEDIVSYYSLRAIARRFPGARGSAGRRSLRHPGEECDHQPPLKRVLSVLFPYAVFAFLALISWSRWIEPYVDSGRELMVPWRISRGEALYRDVRFYYGPLAPLLAAGVDALAGRSLPARIALAAAIALAHIEALRRLAARFLSPGLAGLAAALAVALFFFLRPGGCHLFPYSLSTSIAVAAAAWTLVLVGGPRPGPAWVIATSLLAALLARPETGLAASVAALLPALGPAPRPDRRRRLLSVAAPIGIAAVVYAWISAGTPLATLRQEGWLAFLSVPSEFRRVYSSFSGLDRPALRLAELALALIVLALAAAFLGLVSILAARGGSVARRRMALSVGLTVLFAVSAVCLWPPPEMAESLSLFPPLIRPLPLLVVIGGLWRVLNRVRRRPDDGIFGPVPDEALFLSAVFAGRLILAAGYGGPYAAFYLPLAAVVALTALRRLADRAARSSSLANLPGLVTGALVIFLAFRVASLAANFRNPGWSKVETPAGSLFLPQPYAETTRLALAEIERRTPPGGTAAGFPEIGFLQYVLGRANPLPQDQLFPGCLDAAAEQDAIRRIARRPPDVFVYVNVLAVGLGAVAFGSDYLVSLDTAVRSLSHPVASFGPGARSGERIGDPGFFIEVREPNRP
jgi:hypothetical protein